MATTAATSHSAPHRNNLGPLAGLRVIELASMGPAPFACMLMADMGATILRVAPPHEITLPGFIPQTNDPVCRGRARHVLDLKSAQGVAQLKELVRSADVLIEGYRPGVLERLGLAPAELLAINPQLVIGRMTGWGQTGPLAHQVGHDPNYLALAGVLSLLGPADQPPMLPLNLVGDYGGGAMLLLVGVLAARLNALATGQGQVVDAAMLDGAAQLLTPIFALHASGRWNSVRGSNVFDGGAPFASTYQTGDGRFVAVCALEPHFFQELIAGLGLSQDCLTKQNDKSAWPALKAQIAQVFKTRARDEWVAHFCGTNACVTPVLTLDEAPRHPHNQARQVFSEDSALPAPAPRFSATPSSVARQDLGSPSALLRQWQMQQAQTGSTTTGDMQCA